MSSLFNDSYLNQDFEISSFHQCLFTSPAVFKPYFVVDILVLLPLCSYILCVSLQQQCSKRPSSAVRSHCDSFTFHMAAIELVGILGIVICLCATCLENLQMLYLGASFNALPIYGQLYFQNLTCLEHYLAVVHPITYLGLRSQKWVRIRNVTIGLIWLLCIAGTLAFSAGHYIYLDFALLILSTVAVSFCSISVLCILKQPGPATRVQERGHQSKKKALYTIMTIQGVLMIRLGNGLVWAILDLSGSPTACVLVKMNIWIVFCSSLVMPLLFLQKGGKLECCRNSS